ncbi:MAG TPA: hypothetical protein ENK18_03710 [Deltaproteobacteria bacterium]|nr:hypothetical protein [Deltaproteobacteria bacterium]
MHDDRVELQLQTDCIVGILPRERIEPQPLHLDLSLSLDLDPCGETGELDRGIDYAAVDTQIRFLCIEGRFRLIESLARAVLRLLLAPPDPSEGRTAIERARVRVTKPTVLRAARPSIVLERTAAWAASSDPSQQLLVDAPGIRARRLVLGAGRSLQGAGCALCLGPQPHRVELPLTVEQPTALLYVEARA